MSENGVLFQSFFNLLLFSCKQLLLEHFNLQLLLVLLLKVRSNLEAAFIEKHFLSVDLRPKLVRLSHRLQLSHFLLRAQFQLANFKFTDRASSEGHCHFTAMMSCVHLA